MKCKQCGKTKAGTEKWYQRKTSDVLCAGHGLKVTDLEILRQDEIQMSDVLLISDVSEKKSKHVMVGDLVRFIKNQI